MKKMQNAAMAIALVVGFGSQAQAQTTTSEYGQTLNTDRQRVAADGDDDGF